MSELEPVLDFDPNFSTYSVLLNQLIPGQRTNTGTTTMKFAVADENANILLVGYKTAGTSVTFTVKLTDLSGYTELQAKVSTLNSGPLPAVFSRNRLYSLIKGTAGANPTLYIFKNGKQIFSDNKSSVIGNTPNISPSENFNYVALVGFDKTLTKQLRAVVYQGVT